MGVIPIRLAEPTLLNPYIQAATRDNTRKAYRQDIHHFTQWGVLPTTARNYCPLLTGI